jgi:hypothetical protein
MGEFSARFAGFSNPRRYAARDDVGQRVEEVLRGRGFFFFFTDPN